MFYLDLIIALVFIYWFSSLVAELVLTTPAEKQLPTAIRTGLGYLISIVWFAAAFKLMPIYWGWILGILLLVGYTVSRSRPDLERHLSQAKSIAKSYLKSFFRYFLLANIFLLPLHVARNYGPFTEGGGDVSIYADIAKYLTDHRLAAFGLDDVTYDLMKFAEDPLEPGVDNIESLAHFDERKGNPPIADYQAYRLVNMQKFGSLLFSPVAQWSFLSGTTNLPAFYAMQGFHYASLALSVWVFFSLYGRLPAILSTILVAGSHGLISVYYNVYFIQGMSLMISALVIYLVSAINIKSVGSLRTFGSCLMIIVVVYLHYNTIIIPFLIVPLAVALFLKNRQDSINPLPATLDPIDVGISQAAIPSNARTLMRAITFVIFVFFTSIWLVEGITYELKFFIPFVKNFLLWFASTFHLPISFGPDANLEGIRLFFGSTERLFSMKWLSFFLGLLSQQHFEPLMHVPSVVKSILPWTVSAGVSVLVLSFGLSVVFLWMVLRGEIADINTRRLVVFSLVMYVVCLVVIAFHHVLAQSSLYTQAKGAQNVLVALYVGMVLPFGVAYMLYRDGEKKKWLKIVAWVHGSVLGVFVVSLVALRLIYALSIAYGMGRSSILESSYFSRAEEILREDKDAFVLVEPRTSADTYLGIQPFAGARMVPTRYLALTKLTNVYLEGKWFRFDPDRNILGSDFVSPSDLGHLWHLTAKKIGTRKFVEGIEGGEYEWVAERLANVKEPQLLLFGYDYEAFYGERLRSSKNDDTGWFTFFRNGSAMMVMPAHASTSVLEVKVQPRDGVKFAEMVKEVRAGVARATGEWSVRTDTSDGFLAIHYELPSVSEARLIPLVKYWGEFWMNVRVDDKELREPGASSPAAASVAAVKGEIKIVQDTVRVGEAVTAIWSGLSSSANDDWVGVFPVGGGDDTRVTFAFTGGGAKGSMQMAIPAATAAGKYELRLYSKGGWQKIASSKPINIIQ